MLNKLLQGFTPIDWIALVVFFAGWSIYSCYADNRSRGVGGLRGAAYKHRLEWGRQMVRRENRIVDSSLIGNLVQSVSFYASTTTYVIAGLIAVAGTIDRLMAVSAELPFGHAVAREAVEVKVIMLAAIFIFAYFKFTWSLRQFNYLSILIGAAPSPTSSDTDLEPFARKFSTLQMLAGDDFNRGIRAYYFGFAAGTWFVSGYHFLAFTLVILAVLWRRDFHSPAMRVLSE
ncbi:MAG: DUF599 domain-containing protein [Betaproteobacteria bacterium]